VGPRQIWTGAENLAPHRDSILGLSTRSESLYRLSYPVPLQRMGTECYSGNVTGRHDSIDLHVGGTVVFKMDPREIVQGLDCIYLA